MSESSDYKLFRRKAILPQDRCNRIENIVGTGMPDVNYCINGTEGWIEFKSPTEPKRPLTSLMGSNHKLTIEQRNWHLLQSKAGGISFVLLCTDVRWILIQGRYADLVNDMTVGTAISYSVFYAPKPLAKQRWSDLRRTLWNQ